MKTHPPFSNNDTRTKELQEIKPLVTQPCSGSSGSITAHLEGSFSLISVRETPLKMINMPSCKEEKAPACIILITMMSHLKNFFQEGK